jgi:hypothetical protein
MHVGSDSGGQRAAALYSLIATAKLNGLDPALYFRTILAQIPDHPINRIQELLPWIILASLNSDSSDGRQLELPVGKISLTPDTPPKSLSHSHEVSTKK